MLFRPFYFFLSLCFCPAWVHAQGPAAECAPPKALREELQSHPTAENYNVAGKYFADEKKFACAASAFRQSLKLNPNSAQTHYFLALVLLGEGDAQNAIVESRRSLGLQPDQPKVRLLLGAALSQHGQMEEAIREFQAVLESDAKSIDANDMLAKAYMSEKRYPAAIALLKGAPQEEPLQIDLVMAYSNNGENDQALRLLKKMEEQRPHSAAPHSARANIYTQQRRYEDAAKEFQDALRLNPQDEATAASYVRLLLLQGKFEATLPYAQAYQRKNPNTFDGCYLLGVVDRETGKYAEAKTLLERAVKMSPQHYFARYNLGLTYAKTGDPAGAREQLEKAVQLDPSSPEAHFQLAAVLRSLSLPEESKAQLGLYQTLMASRGQKDVAAAKANEARELLRKGDTREAVDLYRQAVEKDPNDAHLYYDLAIALERKGDRKGELEAISKAIELDPEFAAAHNQLGLLRLQLGQAAEGEKEFKTAIGLNPHEVEAHNNLGILYGQQGRDAEAAELFRAAIESDPGYAPSYVNLAVVLASQTQFGEAESALKKAIRLEPDNAQTRALLTRVQNQLGQQSNAHP
jgi:tetratricopeptide (TPR) repeat protein